MDFFNPWFLAGLLAAGLPVLIHLINRRKAVRRKFPALDFLLRSKKKLARSLKVRQALLLALRIAAMILLPLAMARPYLLSEEESTGDDRLPTGVVFVVDDSASMHYGAGAVWDRAVQEVGDRAAKLRPWDKVSLVYASSWPVGTGSHAEEYVGQWSESASDLVQELQEHAPGQSSTDLVGGLRAASELLAGLDISQKRIVLVTDRQKSGVDLGNLPTGGLGAPVEVLDVHDPESSGNVALVDARYTQKSAGDRPEFEIEATVKNTGDKDLKGVEVRLVLEGESVASGLVDLPAGKSATKLFVHKFQKKGLHPVKLQLAPGVDDHEADNTYYLPIHLSQQARVLVVNGDPRSVPYMDESFYLERALNPGQRSKSAIVVDITTAEGFTARNLDNYDVVALANVEKISRSDAGALLRFVEGGGGALFLAGDHVKAENYNSLFKDLLPRPIRSVKKLADRSDQDASLKTARFGQVDHSHPVFRVFHLPGGDRIHNVETYSYLLLEPTPQGDTKTLASWSDGAPALIERRVGQGRTILLTTTVDRAWTDLPIRTAFLPLVQRVTQYLAKRSTSANKSAKVLGKRVSLSLDLPEGGRFELRDESGERIVLTPDSAEPNAPLSFVPQSAGHYRVILVPDLPGAEPRELLEEAFAVNLDPKEIDLSPISTEELSQVLRGDNPQEGEGAVIVDAPEKKVGFWSILLFLVTLALLAETVLGMRRSFLVKLWNLLKGQKSTPSPL